ncbi:hypothetical protein QCA50_011949 [Cerrena zonata]|uniref:Uncharacterized protein n=1 Tax=Cerrena zonata TaxID=2478898 RepID=A0AAW0FV18_9APHY
MEHPDTHRWSELIPPHTALTFAAIWDPSEGMVTFSGGSLLESDIADSDPCKHISPKEAYDSQSQILTIDRLAFAMGAGERPGRPVGIIELRDLISEDSASVYSGETHTETTTNRKQAQFLTVGRRLLSALDGRIFRSNDRREDRTSTPPPTANNDIDEGFFEDACMTATARSFGSMPVLVNLNLKSKFSVSSTSTTNYVHVFPPSIFDDQESTVAGPSTQSPQLPRTPPPPPRPSTPHPLRAMLNLQDSDSEVWSALPYPHSYHYPSPAGTDTSRSSSSSPTWGRRTRKLHRRKIPLSIVPADPLEVLAREEYNHVVTPTSSPSSYRHRHGVLPFARLGGLGLKRQKSLKKIKELVCLMTARCPHLPGRNEGGAYAAYHLDGPFREVKEDKGWCWILKTGSVLDL